jgi:type I restriction-modification system DNA methylase subunit
LIWELATHLVGLFKPHEYGKVILPMTVLKRFDDALRPTKAASGCMSAEFFSWKEFEKYLDSKK